MGNIIWLASYPKSGNTWLRVFLNNFQHNQDQPIDINQLSVGPLATNRWLFDQETGVKSSDLTTEEIECLRPVVYECLSEAITKPLLMKIHDAFTLNAQGCPLISKAATQGVIYLVRNPLDVAVSLAHHSSLSIDRVIAYMGDPAAGMDSDPTRLHNQLRQRLLAWSDHVRSWIDEPDLNVHVARYEDMYYQPFKTFQAIVRFIGFEDNAGRIERAIAHSRFSTLQQQERDHGFREKLPEAPSFFRYGRSGSWREALTDAQVARLVREHGDVMRRFGYLDDNGDREVRNLMDGAQA